MVETDFLEISSEGLRFPSAWVLDRGWQFVTLPERPKDLRPSLIACKQGTAGDFPAQSTKRGVHKLDLVR
jgi:hypothetical protein